MTTPIFQSWNATRIAQACGGRVSGDASVAATAIANDSRALQGGELFAAIEAERDGHDFISDARRRGARILLVAQDKRPEPVEAEAVVSVDDTVNALGRIGRALFLDHGAQRPDRVVIGITGSNGKTTTKDLVAAILMRAFPGAVLVTQGNLNNQIGLPMTLSRLAPQHRWVVLEMGASQPGDIALLTGIAPVDRAAVTSIAPAHLEGLGSEEEVVAEKGAIFRAPRGGGGAPRVAVVPQAWRASELVPADFGGTVRTFGPESRATVQLTSYRPGPPVEVVLTLDASLAGRHLELALESGLAGRHNGLNLAAATALVWDLLPVERAADSIRVAAREAAGPAGRVRWRPALKGARVLDDSYNANPGSLTAALDVLGEREGRRWLVLGDMLELGETAPERHREAGRVAAEKGCERVWGVGRWADDVVRGARRAGVRQVAAFTDAAGCAAAAAAAIESDHVVLVKGSRGAHVEQVVAALVTEEVT